MDGKDTNQLVKGALLLTLAGLISKLLSAGYRIPLQNLTGDLGFYIYQQVYPLLGIALVLSLYGFPSAISKMTVELKNGGKNLSFKSFYVPVFFLLLAINGVIFLFLYFNAHQIAVWIGDPNLLNTYKYAAFVFLFIPFTALIRGVFQGSYQMKPTAYSQIAEQFIRVFIIIFAAMFVYFQIENIYNIGVGAAFAALCGALGALLILSFFFIKAKPIANSQFSIPWKYYLNMILIFGMAAALNHMVLIVIQFADTFTLVPSLKEYGLPQTEAMKTKGIFDRGQPLIQLGTVLGSSFALAIIPTISKQKLKKDPGAFYQYIQSALAVSFYLAIGSTLGLVIIFPETNILLFQNDKGTATLRILVIAILLSSIAITAASILQGLGYIIRTAGFILIAFFIKWIANQVLVPILGITGSAIATVISLLMLALMMLYTLKRKLPNLKVEKQINWYALVIASTGMSVYLLIIDLLPTDSYSRFDLLAYIVFVVITGSIVYSVLLLRYRAFTKKELAMLPLAPLLIRIHRGRET